MNHGGNYGVVCLDSNEIVVWDIDSAEFRDVLDETLPDTLTVESGGSGVGEHRYYRCRDFSTNTSWNNPEGSVRSRNWHAVGPNSTHPDTGAEYRILHDRKIATVTVEDLGSAMSELGDREAGGGGGGPAAAPPASRQNTQKAEDLQVDPSSQTLQALGFINSDKRRQDIAKVLDHNHPSRRVRAWAAGFLHSACGLTQIQLEKLLQARADWATDNNEIERQVQNMLKKVVRNRRADESVNLDRYLGPDDMTASAVESRKTESGDTSAGSHGGDSSMSSDSPDFDYTSKHSLTVYNADSPEEAEDGERVIRAEVTNMNGRDEDGDRVDTDFVTVTKGTLRDNGEFGVSPEFPQDNKSVGSAEPEDLRLIAQALNEMADQIED
jgi:hypothetical protein